MGRVMRPTIGRRGGKSTGLSLVELLIALAVGAILLGIALPSFDNFTAQRTLTAGANNLVSAVNYARSEAARLGTVVSVTSSDDSDSDNEWGNGICVVVGNPGDCSGTTIIEFAAVTNATLDSVGDLDGVGALSFNSRGMMTNGVAGSLQLCNNDSEIDPGRQVNINLVGRVSTEELACH